MVNNTKKRILLNNIFGVDIDQQAVEVTKLSLLLKVLEGEKGERISKQLTITQERVLPSLHDNIKCGNSLIAPDIYTNTPIVLDNEDDLYTINPFEWNREFPEAFEKGGFDAVIGNPPYVRQELLKGQKEYFKSRYEVFHGTADLYAYFIEKGISLLKEGGQFSYIVANKWMRANYGKQLRTWMSKKSIEEIVDFGDLPVFKKATTYPCILRISKGTLNKISESYFKAVQVETLDFTDLSQYVKENGHLINRKSLDDKEWSLVDKENRALLDKLMKSGIPLGEYVGGKIYRGVLTGLNKAFVIDEITKDRLIATDSNSAEIIKPFLAGRDIKRYKMPISNKYVIFTRRGIEISKYPAILAHLQKFKQELTPRPEGWKDNWNGRKPGSYKWYEVQDSIGYYKEFEKDKILYAEIAVTGQFSLDTNGLYSDTTSYIIANNSKYLLGILNSKLWSFMFSNISSVIRGGFFRWKRQYMEKLPVHIIDFSNAEDVAKHDKIASLVEQLLEMNKRLDNSKLAAEKEIIQRRIGAIDAEINRIVYRLYDLTEEEIKIIEEK